MQGILEAPHLRAFQDDDCGRRLHHCGIGQHQPEIDGWIKVEIYWFNNLYTEKNVIIEVLAHNLVQFSQNLIYKLILV